MRLAVSILWGVFALAIANAAGAAKLAVTDLTYEERVAQYFRAVDYHNRASHRASGSDSERETPYHYSGRSRYSESERSQTDYSEVEYNYNYLEYGELHKFTGDIKGEILKSGAFSLVQAKPVTGKKTDKIFDIIDRIKKGLYPGADYVLFGTVSAIDFRDEQNPVVNSNTMSRTFNLTLTSEFSLINTRNYQVTAAFSATGEGQDVRMAQPGAYVVPSRAKAVAEASKTLGEDVARQLNAQLGRAVLDNTTGTKTGPSYYEGDGQTVIYSP